MEALPDGFITLLCNYLCDMGHFLRLKPGRVVLSAMEHVLEFTSRKLFRTIFCGGWGTKVIAFLYSIYCILILSYVKLLFYGFIDKISNSCGLTDRPDMTLDVYRGRKNNNTTTTTSIKYQFHWTVA